MSDRDTAPETARGTDGAVDATGEDRHWQLRLLDQVLAEEATNEALRRTDPEAYKAKMEAQLPTNTCCFCRDTFRGYGNNPWPVLEEGTACNACNRSIVISARLQAMRR
jgi:hypothetical protein